MYVIKKGNLFVAKPGSEKSYTTKPEDAAVYSSKEEAERNKCGNERVVPIYANS